jgi:hypothetical protein
MDGHEAVVEGFEKKVIAKSAGVGRVASARLLSVSSNLSLNFIETLVNTTSDWSSCNRC